MPDYTPPLGVPAARKVVCYADWTKPHGEGHNRVCVPMSVVQAGAGDAGGRAGTA